MKRLIAPSEVKGKLKAPASKSVAQRAIAMASMANGHSTIYNVGNSNDSLAAIDICKKMGASISGDGSKLSITGGLKWPSDEIHCGESGLSIRMFSAIASIFDKPVTLTGEGSLANRPMSMITDGLTKLGVSCTTNNGKLPITVNGPIMGGIIEVDGSLSSQAITGLLMAAPFAKNDVTIRVKNLNSRPYIDLTIQLMDEFNVKVDRQSNDAYRIVSGQKYSPRNFNVEGDWSGATFMLVAGAIAGEVDITNLNPKSLQADKAIIEALMNAGASISIDESNISVRKGNLKAFDFDARNCPDLFPPLVALAANCQGKTKILGVNRLHGKESDRAATLQQEFAKLGVNIEINNDIMIVEGGTIKSATTHSHGDHRIAMACAIAALNANGEVEIENAEAVNKSYPDFFEDLQKIQINQENR
ncbi:3-phosphoshikimate 1-carboxyvinyltransferase [Tenuifilum thalassicum]|uniref:3-phosphoshikimate 1-carboxyvinyltransferase n=1 Tax=Tenuifilum thalassicum TaxID=2590900 RepID=A0A7D3Y0N4_9BACT|nr:3-phosphoshikimate 1-carboxyvinyltransferase [Tenuifilum thalassicum]QKG80613.1 3-phosphoshikimate 1-carboxyvinyltransferase [Tenuifilum thalassicum]